MPKKNPAAKTAEVIAKGPVPLTLPDDLKQLIADTAAEVQLSKQDTMRHALRRGLPILKQLMTAA